jgi:hypothetical protein
MKQSCLVVVVFVLLAVTGFSSVAQMIPMTNTMRTPYGNVTTTNWVPGPGMYSGSGLAKTSKYKFEITFPNDSIVTTSARLYFDRDTVYIVAKDKINNKTEIYPHQTTKIRSFSSKLGSVDGIVTDSCWLFLVIKGPINGYSRVPEELSISFAQYGNDGRIFEVNEETLKPLLIDDKMALRYLKKEMYKMAILTFNKNQDKTISEKKVK